MEEVSRAAEELIALLGRAETEVAELVAAGDPMAVEERWSDRDLTVIRGVRESIEKALEEADPSALLDALNDGWALLRKEWRPLAVLSLPGTPHEPSARATAIADIEIPREALPSWEEIRRRFMEVIASWNDKLAHAPPGERLVGAPRIGELIDEIYRLLNEGRDRAHAFHSLKQMEMLLESFSIDTGPVLQPPKREFEEALEEAEGLIAELEESKPEEAGHFRRQVDALRRGGLAAYEAGNKGDWKLANENLSRVIAALKPAASTYASTLANTLASTYIPSPGMDDIPAEILLFHVMQEVEKLAAVANQVGVLQDFEEDLNNIVALLQRVDLSEAQAKARIVTIYQNRIAPLRVRIQRRITEMEGPAMADLRSPGWSARGTRAVSSPGEHRRISSPGSPSLPDKIRRTSEAVTYYFENVVVNLAQWRRLVPEESREAD